MIRSLPATRSPFNSQLSTLAPRARPVRLDVQTSLRSFAVLPCRPNAGYSHRVFPGRFDAIATAIPSSTMAERAAAAFS